MHGCLSMPVFPGHRYQQAYLASELSGLTGQYWIGLKKDSKTYSWTSKQNLTYTFWSKAHTGRYAIVFMNVLYI